MYECVQVYAYVCLCVFIVCILVVQETMSHLRRPKINPDSCSQSVDTSGDSKIDIRDDLEICTGLCNEDQMVIQIQNYAISCQCLLCVIQIYYCLYVFTLCYSNLLLSVSVYFVLFGHIIVRECLFLCYFLIYCCQ